MKQGKPLPNEAECREIALVMGHKFSTFLRGRTFEVSLRKDTRGIYATVTLGNATGSYHYPVEGRLANVDHDMDDRDAARFLIAYIEAYFAEYFREDGGVYLPIDWADYEEDGVSLQLKGQIFNLEAERMADELLERGSISRDQGLH